MLVYTTLLFYTKRPKMKSIDMVLNILTIQTLIFQFFDITKVNIFCKKHIHIFHLYQNVTKHLFRKNICKPYIFVFFYVDEVDNSVDKWVFGIFSTFLNVDNFLDVFESLGIFFRQKNCIVQTADFYFFFHKIYPHLLCGKCG